MGAVELDETDCAIVRELRADGRLPFEALASRVGLSRAAARLRVRTATIRSTTRLTSDRDGLWKDALAAARILKRNLGRAA